MKHILIADDYPITTSLISRATQSQGHAVHFAYDVMQAVMTVSRSRLDLVIVDVKMPGGNGLDVVRRMKISNRTGPIPIIVISGTMDAETRRKAIAMGADVCLQKPLDFERLQETVNLLLKGQPAAYAAPRPKPNRNVEVCYHGA